MIRAHWASRRPPRSIRCPRHRRPPTTVGCDGAEPQTPPTGRDALVEICLDTCADDEDCQRCESDELGFTLEAGAAAELLPELELEVPAVSEFERPSDYGTSVEPTSNQGSGLACALAWQYCTGGWTSVQSCNASSLPEYGYAFRIDGAMAIAFCGDDST